MALTKVSRGLLSTGIVDNSNATAITIDSSENVSFATSGGLIKSIGGDVALVQGAVGVRINDSGSAISPTTASANSDGAVDLGVSNIRFKDIYLSGGAYLGGTAAANKLDSYEEGTWTPTVVGCSITVARAYYTKIGNLVTLHFNISVTATDNSSGSPFSIGGKPFVGSSANAESNGSLMGQFITTHANTINLSLYTYSRHGSIEIYQTRSNNLVWVTLRRSQVGANLSAFIGSMTYETDT